MLVSSFSAFLHACILRVTGLLFRLLYRVVSFLQRVIFVGSKDYWRAKVRGSLALGKGKWPEGNCRSFQNSTFW